MTDYIFQLDFAHVDLTEITGVRVFPKLLYVHLKSGESFRFQFDQEEECEELHDRLIRAWRRVRALRS